MRRLLGAHLPAASPERRETVAGECLGCQTQFVIDVRLPLPATCPAPPCSPSLGNAWAAGSRAGAPPRGSPDCSRAGAPAPGPPVCLMASTPRSPPARSGSGPVAGVSQARSCSLVNEAAVAGVRRLSFDGD